MQVELEGEAGDWSEAGKKKAGRPKATERVSFLNGKGEKQLNSHFRPTHTKKKKTPKKKKKKKKKTNPPNPPHKKKNKKPKTSRLSEVRSSCTDQRKTYTRVDAQGTPLISGNARGKIWRTLRRSNLMETNFQKKKRGDEERYERGNTANRKRPSRVYATRKRNFKRVEKRGKDSS